MKKSMIVALSLAGTVAAMVAGCSHPQTADCVGPNGQVLPDNSCQNTGVGGTTYIGNGGPHWIYGGHIINNGGYQRVTGGSITPSSSREIDTRSGTTLRGGFGDSSFFHGMHGGGE